jgi:ketosteroid isomerase-like protein
MPTRPEDLHPALAAAFTAGDLEAALALYEPSATFVIKPGVVTDGPDELRAALRRYVELGARLTIEPRTFVRSGDVVLALGRFTFTGRRRDGSPFERESGFADVLRQTPDGNWLIAIDNGFNDT